MSFVTSHVLDTALGRPAEGIPVALIGPGGEVIASAQTDADGRVTDLGPEILPAGIYIIEFQLGGYFARSGRPAFYPRLTIEAVLDPEQGHYHLPLLLSPFGYSTYRGS